jgi:hypothetical protein
MEMIASELESLLNQHYPQLHKLEEEKAVYKPLPNKWSKKELIGHMIDSAQNNIRRFIVAQYEDQPKIVYNQDKWVEINNYQDYSVADLVNLWHLLNKQICTILKNTPSKLGDREVQTEAVHSIEWLANDYIKHLKHHLHQVLELEPFVYP